MCEECDYMAFLDEIESMMGNDEFAFASDTLEGIHQWVEEHQHCTENQRAAIDNIRD